MTPPVLSGYADLRLAARTEGASIFAGRRSHDGRHQAVLVRVLDVREFDPAARRRFRADRKVLAEVTDHGRLVELVDHGFTADGRPYDVEVEHGEFRLPGAVGPQTSSAWSQVVHVGLAAAAALDALHRAGLYHGCLCEQALRVSGTLSDTASQTVVVGDYRATERLGASAAVAASQIEADLQGLALTLLAIAGESPPEVDLSTGWETNVAAVDAFLGGPRTLGRLLVSMLAPDGVSEPVRAADVLEGLRRLQTSIGGEQPAEDHLGDPVIRFDPEPTDTGHWTSWDRHEVVEAIDARVRPLVGVASGIAAFLVLAVSLSLVYQRQGEEAGATGAFETSSSSAVVGDRVGAPIALVPLVGGLEREVGIARVRNAGFVAEISEEFDPTAPRGSIVSSTPPAGAEATVGSTVEVVVSRGPELLCEGRAEQVVRRQAAEADLTVAGLTRGFSESFAADRVIRCVVYDDSQTVIIVVSDGPRPID